jgi:AmmeMemoRadiSam system protein A
VTANELNDLEIEVSVLTLPELITADSPEEYLLKIQPGVDGIILDYKGRGATYLPQVWEQIPEKGDFLSSLCNKAFLPSDCWRKPDVKIYRYKVIAFKESDFR